MSKYTFELKKKVVLEYLNGGIGSEKVSATVLLQILMTCAKIYKKRIAIIALRAKT